MKFQINSWINEQERWSQWNLEEKLIEKNHKCAFLEKESLKFEKLDS